MKELNLTVQKVMDILLRALDHIDVRLVDHGHRVAYMVYKMMEAEGTYRKRDLLEICIVTALHDIGAYKTEEIEHMMRFETTDVFDHSIYGYLFLKHMSPLSQWADIVLYHHMNYEMYPHFNSEHLKIADMIHLADRMDVVLQRKAQWLNYEEISRQQDIRFGKSTVDLFRRADIKYDIKGNIMNGSYLKEMALLVSDTQYDEKTLLEFIKMIAYSIDFRSESTVSHVAATVCISMKLGELLGLKERELKKIQLGAYLHDIGKISTPLEILEKNGKLTPEETRIMREHIDITGEILKGRIHEDIRQISYRHHEKIDGSGYPLKLSGDQLTLSDRIVAVADIMSALTGKRSYKESFPKEVVIDILNSQKEKGTLCGKVVDTAISNYDIIIKNCRRNTGAVTEMYERISKEFRLIKKRFEDMQ